MHLLLGGGSGFLGQALIQAYQQKGWQITVVGRSQAKIQDLFGSAVTSLTWDELTPAVMNNIDLIINLAGADISKQRWTPAYKQQIWDSRVNTTYQLAQACLSSTGKRPVFFCANGVSIYSADDNVHDEADNIPATATSFLQALAQAWEAATLPAQEAGVRVVIMRFAPILAAQGGLLKRMLMAYRLGLGGKLGNGLQPFPWISLTDVLHAIDFIYQRPNLAGAFNFISPQAATQSEFAHTLAKILHRPCWLTTPAWLLKALLGQMADELILNTPSAAPKRLLEAGFQFAQADLRTALEITLGDSKH